jgi:hypothetical protein
MEEGMKLTLATAVLVLLCALAVSAEKTAGKQKPSVMEIIAADPLMSRMGLSEKQATAMMKLEEDCAAAARKLKPPYHGKFKKLLDDKVKKMRELMTAEQREKFDRGQVVLQKFAIQQRERSRAKGAKRQTRAEAKAELGRMLDEEFAKISTKKAKDPSKPERRPASTPIPKGVTYTIINKNLVPGMKRSLDVRLSKKVSRDVLTSIAMKLKNSDSGTYKRTFIGYYLPGMKVGAAYWATTHFTPELKVRILGLTAKQERALKQKADPSGHILGKWMDKRPLVGHRITIFKKDGKLFMQNAYKDGSSGKTELVEKKSPLGRRFEKADGSGGGDYWVLDSDGNLQIRDGEGLISTSKKIK